MELNDFNLREAAAQRVELNHPATDAPLIDENTGEPVWVEVYGSDSEVYKSAMRSQANKKMAKRNPQKQTLEEIEGASTKVLAACTVAWSASFEVDGEVLECTPKSAEWLYSNHGWVREQVDAFVHERANFLASA